MADKYKNEIPKQDTSQKKYTKANLENNKENLENKRFWHSERKLFVGTLLIFLVSACLLTITEQNNLKVGPYNTFLDHLFNSISVGTLTGLFRGDSGNYTIWGQVVLLLNMIICGIISSVIAILLVLFVRVGLDRRQSLRREIKRLGLDFAEVIGFILADLLLLLTLGTILFLLTGVSNLWEGLFNATSHVFNGGATALTKNMIRYRENLPMLVSGAILITIGGLGSSIRAVFYKWVLTKLGLQKLATKISNSILAPKNFAIAVLLLTVTLQLFGAFTIFIAESGNPGTFGTLSRVTAGVNSYYMSVSAKTAGFTTIPDLNQASDKTISVLILLMSIGDTSGSFTGGIFKFAAIIFSIIYFVSRYRAKKEIKAKMEFVSFVKKTHFEENLKILELFGLAITTALTIILLFYLTREADSYILLFEAASAMTNTGLSLGATGVLGPVSLLVIMLLMIISKLDFVSFIVSFFPKIRELFESAEKKELPIK